VGHAPTKLPSLNSTTRLKSLLRIRRSAPSCNCFARRVKTTSITVEAPGATILQTKFIEKESPDHPNKQRRQQPVPPHREAGQAPLSDPRLAVFRHHAADFVVRVKLCGCHYQERRARSKAKFLSTKANRATLTSSLLSGSLRFNSPSHVTSPIPSLCHLARYYGIGRECIFRCQHRAGWIVGGVHY
jgi:hypothetical protein